MLQFPGGSANLTYLLRVGDTELVLRRPPFGTIAPGAHDMRREYKVLSQLWRHFDRAPRAYVFCDDPDVLGADFFVMERRRGEVVRDELPDALGPPPRARTAARLRRGGRLRRPGAASTPPSASWPTWGDRPASSSGRSRAGPTAGRG